MISYNVRRALIWLATRNYERKYLAGREMAGESVFGGSYFM